MSEMDGTSTVGTLNNRIATANTMSRANARSGTQDPEERYKKTVVHQLSAVITPATIESRGARKQKLPFGFMVQ
jgi:hypothetical protein